MRPIIESSRNIDAYQDAKPSYKYKEIPNNPEVEVDPLNVKYFKDCLNYPSTEANVNDIIKQSVYYYNLAKRLGVLDTYLEFDIVQEAYVEDTMYNYLVSIYIWSEMKRLTNRTNRIGLCYMYLELFHPNPYKENIRVAISFLKDICKGKNFDYIPKHIKGNDMSKYTRPEGEDAMWYERNPSKGFKGIKLD